MNDPENHHGLKLTEIALIMAVVLALGSTLLPGMNQARKDTQERGDTVAATLQRLESAKAQYAVYYKKKRGETVTLEDLVRKGYLNPMPNPTAGGTYVIGAVGVPVEYDEDGHKPAGP